METGMSQAYLAAMAASYANQEGGITIPADRLNDIVEIPLGFQPLGICARPADGGGDDIAVADYFGPAICTARVKRDEKGLNFKVDWIRGARFGFDQIRLFPDVASPGGANRMQTVNWGRDGTLWIGRNTGREFFVLSPDAKCGWHLVEKVELPAADRVVHSALVGLGNQCTHTVESTSDLKCWSQVIYAGKPNAKGVDALHLLASFLLPSWFYGLAMKNGVFAVTDFQATVSRGIYDVNRTDQPPRLVVPNVWGTGICFLSDGSALVSRYGQSHPLAFNGLPGALIYVPARMFA